MKNRKGLSILTSLIAALFILSMFSGIAAAQSSGEQIAKGQYQIQKQRYEETRDKFEVAKQSFDKAYAQLKNAKDNKSQEELNQKTQDYLENAIDHAIANLEVLKTRAQNQTDKGAIPTDAVAIIDGHIAQLQQIRTNVQQASTMQELKDANKALKEQWNTIRLETRYYFGLILNERINNFITKGNNATARLDAAIQKMKSQGKDTTKLETDEANFKNSMNNAENSEQATAVLLANPNGFAPNGTVTNSKDAAAFMLQVDKSQRETIKDLRAASRQLIEFVRDFRKLAGNKATVDGTGKSGEGVPGTTVTGTPTQTLSGSTLTSLSGRKMEIKK
ncbi:MAG: hypothetical protein O8C66_06130 [Candidatus Methanoperedens sp.]|nr:hypothetical protein [Candidatus Methanoperedens sp.]MCZ7370069.1 hypothetical protein [Candidatus Methanoperedens sp.]